MITFEAVQVLAAFARQFAVPAMILGVGLSGWALIVMHDRRRDAEHEAFMEEARDRLRPCEDSEL